MMYKVLCVIMSLFLTVMSFFGFDTRTRNTSATVTAAENTFGKGTQEASVEFDRQKINTVELEFRKTGEAEVVITSDGTELYRRTGTEDYRFCAFPTTETDNITVSVNGEASLKKVTVSYKTSTDKDFRVTAYVANDSAVNINNISSGSFDVITDVIIIGSVSFDENGVLSVDRSVLDPTVENLRSVIGDRDVEIHINILGPDPDGGIDDWNKQMDSKAAKHSQAFGNESFLTDVVALADEYDFDGIFFDYEYPLKAKYWRDLGKFIAKLDGVTDRKIGLAVAEWNLSIINPDIVKYVDMYEFMQYDMFDDCGAHSSFATAVSCYETTEDMLFDRDKVDLGVPFYGRPADGSGYWPSYPQVADVLGTQDGADTPDGYSYFNCPQTIYDKTAYALDKELGGMMVWHYSCDIRDTDNALSLFGTMKRCIEDRVVL